MGDEIIEFDAGWVVLQEGIEKIKRTLEGSPEPPFTAEESMKLYTLTYNMCNQSPPYNFSSQIYYKCKKAFEEYITLNVSPSLIEKHDEFLLRELVFRWGKHKEMIRWMTHIFKYINRHFVFGRELPPLREVGQTCFNDMVYKVVIPKVKDTVIALIVKEREGDQIDRVLLKDTLDILDEIGKYNYERDFEPYMLQETGAYYSRKASSWIEQDSCPEYMFKSEECLNKERDRVSHYLHLTSEMKLLDKVRHELLVVQANRLIEKVDSGCRALLEDGKREDLCRMYRLYLQIPEGLDPVADIFRQHVTAEGIALVQQAELVATALNARDVNESALINKLLMLNAKYMVYVTECFQKNSQFRKALKEAFSEIYNRSVTGQFLSEGVLVALCDTVLKMKLSDEDIEMKD